MDAIQSIEPARLHLLLAPRKTKDRLIMPLISHLAINGLVYVLDGGNSFNALGLARSLKLMTNQAETALGRVQVARAFTCHQMAALLSGQSETPIPVVVLEMLDTFRDENVPEEERLRLLEDCLADLERLARRAPVLAAVSESRAVGEHLERLQKIADKCLIFKEPEQPPPLTLF